MTELQFLCQISAWNIFPYMICIARKRSKGVQLFTENVILNWLMGSQHRPLKNWIFNGNTDIN